MIRAIFTAVKHTMTVHTMIVNDASMLDTTALPLCRFAEQSRVAFNCRCANVQPLWRSIRSAPRWARLHKPRETDDVRPSCQNIATNAPHGAKRRRLFTETRPRLSKLSNGSHRRLPLCRFATNVSERLIGAASAAALSSASVLLSAALFALANSGASRSKLAFRTTVLLQVGDRHGPVG